MVDRARKRGAADKDVPFALYQIQDKFRDEPRAKSGLLRGREFSMKDMYSFHATEEDLLNFYEKSKIAYLNVFKRCGLDALVVEASGGSFSKEFSHEFQALTPFGEDMIFYCPNRDFAQNKEIAQVKTGDKCPVCSEKILEGKAIEVGNIFKLYAKYSAPMKLQFTDAVGKKKDVIMGCYGIGPSRVMGAIVEVSNDKNGIIWPTNVAPYKIHLLTVGDSAAVIEVGEKLYNHLVKKGQEVLFDDRVISPGAKFADSDLMGIPTRLIISEKTLTQESAEFKRRGEAASELKPLKEFYA